MSGNASPFYRECFLEVFAIRNRFRIRPPLICVDNTCVEVGELA